MFEEPPIYYILISLIFLIVFGSVAFATWMVWLTAAPFIVKLCITAAGFFYCAAAAILYTVTVD